MSISGAHDVLPRRWRRPRAVLPAPTADEVAAVRARVDARRGRLFQDARARVAGAVAGSATLAVVVGLFAADLATGGAFDGSRIAVIVAGSLQLVVLGWRLAYCRRVDEAVRRRLATSAQGPDDPATDGTAGPQRFLSPFECAVAFVALVGPAAVALTSVMTPGPGATGALRSGALTAAALASALGAARVVQARPVGRSAVLRAVDGALRRRDLALALTPAWFLLVFAFQTGPSRAVGDAATLAFLTLVALFGLAHYLRDDGWLLRDGRLVTAPPPAVWLADA